MTNCQIPLHGPDWTRPDKVRGLCLLESGPVGSGRARVVEFCCNFALLLSCFYTTRQLDDRQTDLQTDRWTEN